MSSAIGWPTQRVWDDNHQLYGPRKVWRQLRREDVRVARCTVRAMGLAGAVRGRAWVTTTQASPDAGRLPDLVERDFTATRRNQLWVSGFTYVATRRGFVHVACVSLTAPDFRMSIRDRIRAGCRAS